MKNKILLYLFGALALQLSAQTYPVQTFQLENGLTVFLNEDSTASRIFGAVVVNAGSKHDPADATGIAHYLEHLLFKGTTRLGTLNYDKEKVHLDSINLLYDRLSKTKAEDQRLVIQLLINEQAQAAAEYGLPNEFDKMLKSIGGTGVNAFTNSEMTFYHNYFPPNQLEKWLDLYSHRFEEPVFRSFQSELEVVYEEKNRAMDDFQRTIVEKLEAEVFRAQPYGTQTTLGSIEHLKNPSLIKMYEFFNAYYVANNMALILCGNFEAETVLPLIKEKFGRWRSGEIPAFPDYPKTEFKGKEVRKVRITPIKAGILGFKTVPKTHPDRVALDAFNYMIFNDKETGMLNRLQLDNQLLWCGAVPNLYNDDGATIVFFVPKLFFQSLRKAESLAMGEIKKVQEGEFEVSDLKAVKNQVYVEFVKALENLETRAIAIAEAFNMGVSWETFSSYPDLIRVLKKEDLVRVANRYFGEDFIAMYSRMGFPKKPKLDKPPYRPVVSEQKGRSDYAAYFEKLPSTPIKPRFIDFKKDVDIHDLSKSGRLYSVNNPVNDVFSLTFRYHVGTETIKNLDVAASLMNYAGADQTSLSTLKDQFAQLGVSYRFSANTNYFDLRLSGPDQNLEAAIDLVKALLDKPQANENSRKVVVNLLQTERRFEKSTPSQMGAILMNYALYGASSPFLTRASIREVRQTPTVQLLGLIRQALSYRFSAHYAGGWTADKVADLLKSLPCGAKEAEKIQLPVKTYSEPTIFFVHNKKAVQSQVYYYLPGRPFQPEDYPKLQAFNTYFGLGFSSLVMQEIREYRSLAYSAYGRFLYPAYKTGVAARYVGFIGCQGDKTLEAVEVMNRLLADMPVKKDRLPALRENLRLRAATAYPGFRTLSTTMESFQILNFDQDPNALAYPVYEQMDFDLIEEYYRENVQGKPAAITIYGDKKRVDLEALRKIGRVVELKRKDFWTF